MFLICSGQQINWVLLFYLDVDMLSKIDEKNVNIFCFKTFAFVICCWHIQVKQQNLKNCVFQIYLHKYNVTQATIRNVDSFKEVIFEN